MEKYTSIGFTKKEHRLKGDLKLLVEDEYLEDLLKAPVIFLSIKGRHLPYFVEDVKLGNELTIKLEDVDSKEAAHLLSSKEIFLQAANILKEEEKELVLEVESNLVFGHLVHFTLVDSELGELGKIIDVMEFPQQEMAVISHDEKEVFIPLHESLIEKIDEKKQYVYMNLPDGILEV
ncbi:MAG: 16S rRNA processing protein RimM [Granulosicoccus sp.]|jgi:16S rRNA processing protein RimM